MSQSLVKINLHIVFSTKNRSNYISKELSNELYPYMATIGKNKGSFIYCIGGIENHIHIACTLPRSLTISSLVESLKTSSSKWIKTKSSKCADFAWQHGYAAFSIGQSQVETIVKYIGKQYEHHYKKPFEDELLELFQKYDVEYDEKYLWN